jgi:hypothetical protein
VHYCVDNMPGGVAKTSTLALTYAVEIANKGWKKALKENEEIRLGANMYLLEVSPSRLHYLSDIMPKNCFVVSSGGRRPCARSQDSEARSQRDAEDHEKRVCSGGRGHRSRWLLRDLPRDNADATDLCRRRGRSLLCKQYARGPAANVHPCAHKRHASSYTGDCRQRMAKSHAKLIQSVDYRLEKRHHWVYSDAPMPSVRRPLCPAGGCRKPEKPQGGRGLDAEDTAREKT